MADKELLVIKKSRELMKHTFMLTSNANRYPKKYRFSLVDRMQNRSMSIYECLHEANRTDITHFKRERMELQTRAITYCDQLLAYIELSRELNIIEAKSMEYWSKMVCDVKYMAIAWRKGDRGR